MKTQLNAEINVTPLVDVCLVLLIIFMVVIPTMVNGVDVRLPQTSATAGVDARVLPLTIKEDGTVYVAADVIRREELGGALQRLHSSGSARPIAVRADTHVQYGEVVSVISVAREAGWEDITLVGERLPQQ